MTTWPDICCGVFWEIGELVDSLLVQLRVLDRVSVVRTLQRVESAVLERLLATTPAY